MLIAPLIGSALLQYQSASILGRRLYIGTEPFMFLLVTGATSRTGPLSQVSVGVPKFLIVRNLFLKGGPSVRPQRKSICEFEPNARARTHARS